MDVGKVTIYEAAEKGDFELVKWIVEYSRASLNEFDDDHRTVLHYAAKSGNAQMFRYLVERCGLDPLQGDKELITPWDIVHETGAGFRKDKNIDECFEDTINIDGEDGYREIEEYLEKCYGCKYEDFYRNPIRTGFFPDPSICRVGDDYYMVNSSFIFFPCIPISHSKDLVHWEIIGHAITNPAWAYLDELEGGRGYWAPDITYYKGKFYIAATYRLNDTGPVYRRQMVVCSDKPEGPYSKPVFIDEDGIDPGLFNDDDGKRYMLLNRGARIFELDETGTKKISDSKLLYYGTNKRAPEGPHIYKKDGYYYLLQAEGGTGPGHMVTVSRSKELFGVYEPCPYNPIMRQKDEGATIQRCGHGDLVETPDGRWFMVYLCGRKIGEGYSILGRETALDPVTWTADGWPIVNNLKGPSCMQVKPFAKNEQSNQNKDLGIFANGADTDTCTIDIDKISPCGLPIEFMTPRTFKVGDISFVKDGNDCRLEITAGKYKLSDIRSRNIVLRRQTSFSFEFSAMLEIPELSDGQTAGITGYYDENTFFEFGITRKNGQNYIYSNEHIGDEDKFIISDESIESDASAITLNMYTDYLERTLAYSIEDSKEYQSSIIDSQYQNEAKNSQAFSDRNQDVKISEETIFTTLHNVNYLCDEGLSRGKRFTGALVGMYAYGNGDDKLKVRFRKLRYNDV